MADLDYAEWDDPEDYDPEDDDDSLGFAAREEEARALYDLTPQAAARAALARRIDRDILERDDDQ